MQTSRAWNVWKRWGLWCAALTASAVVVALVRLHASSDPLIRLAQRDGVRVLDEADMRAVVGGFTPPKQRFKCTTCRTCQESAQSDVNPDCDLGQEGDGSEAPSVDPGTGSVGDRVAGMSIAATGGGLSVNFSYDSDLADGTNTALNLSIGYGWTHTYDMSLMEVGPDMALLKGDGRVTYFNGGPLGYIPSPGEFDRLVRVTPTQYKVTTTSGTVYHFNLLVSGPWPGARHMLTQIIDANGRTTTCTYDGSNRLVQTADQFGNALTYEYDPGHSRLAKITDPLGRATQFAYDADGTTLVQISRPDGTVIAYTYNANRQMIRKSVLDPCPRRGDADRDGDVDELDLAAMPACIGGPSHLVTHGACRVFDVERDNDVDLADFAALQSQMGAPPITASGPCPETEAYNIEYDPSTQRAKTVRDRDGNVILDAVGPNRWQVDHAQSLLTGEMIYVPGSVDITDNLGNAWTYEYDAHGQITRVHAPLVSGQPALQTYEYDPASRMVRKYTDPLGRVTERTFDQYGNVTSLTDAEGNVTSNAYEHATLHRLRTRSVEPDGDVWIWTYDANGNLLQETDPLIESPTDAVTTYAYDGLGRRTQMTDRNGHVTTYAYDGLSRRSSQTVDPGGLGLTTTYAYDVVGNMTLTTDPRGIATQYQYDARDRVTQTTRDPGGLGLATSYAYDGRGNRTLATNPRGYPTTYDYDHRDRLVRTIDAQGNETQHSYDANNNRVSTTDRNGNVTTYEYDTRNRLVRQVEDAGGGSGDLNITTRYDYDAADNRIRATREVDASDGADRVMEYEYDGLNRVTRTTVDPGGLGLVTEYDYAPPGGGGCGCNGTPGTSQTHKITDANGHVTYYYYDTLDRRTKEVRKVTDTADNEGDADDAITVTTYDPVGNMIESVTEADPSPDLRTVYTYDAADRRTQQVVDPGIPPANANLTTTYVYDGNGNTVQTISPNGNVTTSVYDYAERMTSSADSIGPRVTYQYDANNNVVRQLDGNGNGNTTLHQYDSLDRMSTQYDALDRPTTYTYDPVGNMISMTDRNGHVTSNGYDGVNRRTSERRAAGNLDIRTVYAYDDAGNTRTIQGHNQTQGGPEVQVTEYIYDAANRRIQEIHPDDEDAQPRDVTFTYDPAGNLIVRRDQNQDYTVYQYDDLDRLAQRQYSLDPGSPSYPALQLPDTYTYDRASQVLTATHEYALPDPDVVMSHTYDGVGRVVYTVQDANTVGYTYVVDAATNQRELTYSSGRIVREEYDDRDRLVRVSDQPADTSISVFTYDAADRGVQQLYGNATTAAWSYNANNWTTQITHANTNGPFIDLAYGYDDEGNRLYARHGHELDASELYTYDAADRLVDFQRGTLNGTNDALLTYAPDAKGTQRQQWTLDLRGNWLVSQIRLNSLEECEERFANKANEYTTVEPGLACPPVGGAPTILDHDDNGNLTDDPLAGPGSVGLHYEYDVENRLARVKRLSDNMVIARYFYDALGRRVRDAISNSGALDGTTYRVLDGEWRTLAEYDGGANLLREFTHGRRLDETLTLDRNLNADGTCVGPGDERLHYHRNALDSTYGLTDNDGDLAEAYRYDPYGSHTVLTGPGADIAWFTGDEPTAAQSARANPYLFTGRELDAATQEDYYRARSYQPNRGRFTRRDPLGTWGDTMGGGNGYLYVGGRPTFATDPTGLKCCCCCVENVKIGNIRKYNDGTLYGHKFDFTVDLAYVEDQTAPLEDCTLEWWEKTDRPPAWQIRMGLRPNTWQDMHALVPRSPLWEKWDKRTKPCTGKESVTLEDPPAADTRLPARTLYFKLTVKSAPGCPCSVISHTVYATQVLVPDGKGGITTQDMTPGVAGDQL